MTVRFGKGFSRSNLQNMRLFYLAYPKCQTLSGISSGVQKIQSAPGKSETVSRKFTIRQTVSAKFQISRTLSDEFEPVLSWSYYCELLKTEEPLAHSFYEHPFRSHIHGVVVERAASSLVG